MPRPHAAEVGGKASPPGAHNVGVVGRFERQSSEGEEEEHKGFTEDMAFDTP